MKHEDAAKRLSELGNTTRLSIFRYLVKVGSDGVPVGQIQKALGLPGSTLSHHISRLVSAGGTAISEGSLAGTVQPKIASMTAAFWVWGLAGLTGITILIISAGIVPGIRTGIFWPQILSNLTFVGKAVGSILPYTFCQLSAC